MEDGKSIRSRKQHYRASSGTLGAGTISLVLSLVVGACTEQKYLGVK